MKLAKELNKLKITHQTVTCSKLTTETLEMCEIYSELTVKIPE